MTSQCCLRGVKRLLYKDIMPAEVQRGSGAGS